MTLRPIVYALAACALCAPALHAQQAQTPPRPKPAAPRIAPVVRPATTPAPARPPGRGIAVPVSDTVGRCSESRGGPPGAPRAAFDAKRRALTAAGVASGPLLDEAAVGQDALRVQRWTRYTLLPHAVRDPRTCGWEYSVIAVQREIRDAWQALGGERWGVPLADQKPIGEGNGAFQAFNAAGPGNSRDSAIYWSNLTGAHPVTGTVHAKFLADGGVPALGYPVEPTRPVEGGGHASRFRLAYRNDHHSTVYAQPDGRAYTVRGGIHDLWYRLGGGSSFLGWPRSDELPAGKDRARHVFQGGSIGWSAQRGAFVETPPYRLEYLGFTVFKQPADQIPTIENSEYAFYLSVAPRLDPDAPTATKLPRSASAYEDMRPGRWRGDPNTLYAGTADALLLMIGGAEIDSSQPDELLPLITRASSELLKQGATALGGLIGGPAGGAVGGQLGDLAGEPIGKAIHEALDLGPDMLQSAAYLVPVSDLHGYLASPPARTQALGPSDKRVVTPPHHFHVDMTSHGGHHLRLYFAVVPGGPNELRR